MGFKYILKKTCLYFNPNVNLLQINLKILVVVITIYIINIYNN